MSRGICEAARDRESGEDGRMREPSKIETREEISPFLFYFILIIFFSFSFFLSVFDFLAFSSLFDLVGS